MAKETRPLTLLERLRERRRAEAAGGLIPDDGESNHDDVSILLSEADTHEVVQDMPGIHIPEDTSLDRWERGEIDAPTFYAMRRQSLKKTLAQMAAQTGLTVDYLAKLEKDVNVRPSFHRLRLIAEALSLSSEKLLAVYLRRQHKV